MSAYPITDQSAAMYAIIVPGNSSPSSATTDPTGTSVGASGESVPTFKVQTATSAPDTTYVFDAVMRAAHRQRLRPTENPIQTGANMSDHAIIMPATVTLSIVMTDAMQAFNSSWGLDNNGKSIAAYQVLLGLQQSRQLVTLTTRLWAYTNMLLVDLPPIDDFKTNYGLRADITFQQIFQGQTQQVPAVSDRPDSTNSNDAGNTQASQTLSPATQDSNLATVDNCSTIPNVVGATSLASFPIAQSPLGNGS